MEYKRIEELTTVVTGGTPSTGKREYWDGGNIPWLQSGCCQNCDVNSTEKYITQEGYDNSSARIMPASTVMIALTGATAGKVGYLNFEACGNQSITGIFPCNSMNQRYLFYYLLSQREKILTDCVGGAQAHISQGYVKNIKVPVLPLSEQKQIVEVLTKLSTVISMQQNEIKTLDNLVKARFVEMFGDMLLNSLEWPEKPLESLADIVSGITKGRKTTETGLIEVPYMAVSNVKSGYIDWTTIKTILATKQEIEQYRLMPDDILMTEGGDPDKVGRGAIIKNPLENSIHQNHIFRVRLDKSELLPAYFAEYLQHQKAKRYFLGCAKQTTGIASINMRQLRALPVLIPPLSLQNQFAAFVAEVDKSKLFVESAAARKPLDLEFFPKVLCNAL